MRSGVGAVVLVVVSGASAGELTLVNGGRIGGELANETVVVSTDQNLVEVAPDEVVVLARDGIQLTDGRIVRGNLVGDRLRVRTALGEIAVSLDEVSEFRATNLAAYQDRSLQGEAQPLGAASARLAAAVPSKTETRGTTGAPSEKGPTPQGRVPGPGAPLEVVADETTLRRDAFGAGLAVGKVARGERVTYVDSIDRRLRILNVLVFDGGHWIRVRAANGTEGWLPADAIREAP
jgi:hypothetical protein